MHARRQRTGEQGVDGNLPTGVDHAWTVVLHQERQPLGEGRVVGPLLDHPCLRVARPQAGGAAIRSQGNHAVPGSAQTADAGEDAS